MNGYKSKEIKFSHKKTKAIALQSILALISNTKHGFTTGFSSSLTVSVVFSPSAVHLSCFVNAEKELVGRIKSPQSDVTFQMIITASVPFQCPGTVGATSHDLKGFMSCTRRRTGPCDTASGDKEQGEAYQGKRGSIGQRDEESSGDSNSGGAKDRFRTEMSHGRRPSAHVGSGSQGAPCAGCRHADD